MFQENYGNNDNEKVSTNTAKINTTINTKSKLKSSCQNNRTKIEKLCLAHTYSDHAHDPIYKEQSVFGIGGSSSSSSVADDETIINFRRGPRGGVMEPFPLKLRQMLMQVEKEGNNISHVVSWQPHGRCFVIHNPKQFTKEVMPKFFNQSKFTSFQRQVNLYGFRRLTKGMDKGGYYHELFLRSRPDLCKRIIRQRIKGTGTKCAYLSDTEPNFYAMECCWEENTFTIPSANNSDKLATTASLSIIPNKEAEKSPLLNTNELALHTKVLTPSKDTNFQTFSKSSCMLENGVIDHPNLVSMAQSIAETTFVAPLACPPRLPTVSKDDFHPTNIDKFQPTSIFNNDIQDDDYQILNSSFNQQHMMIDSLISCINIDSHFLDDANPTKTTLLHYHQPSSTAESCFESCVNVSSSPDYADEKCFEELLSHYLDRHN